MFGITVGISWEMLCHSRSEARAFDLRCGIGRKDRGSKSITNLGANHCDVDLSSKNLYLVFLQHTTLHDIFPDTSGNSYPPSSHKSAKNLCLEPGSKQKDCHLASNDAMGQADVPSM